MPKFNIINPNDLNLSLKAIGILSTMLNVPENDYCTEEEIHAAIPADSLEEIRSALNELVKNKYLFQLDGNIYAVNKRKIPQMKII